MNRDTLLMATAGRESAPSDWLPASQVRPLIFEDPALLWLEYHGAQFGFQPDTSPYDYLDFIAEKSRQFEAKWLQEMAPAAPVVCRDAHDVTSRSKVEETWELMRQGVPCISQPALWWAPERIYGAPGRAGPAVRGCASASPVCWARARRHPTTTSSWT